jgi:hypothetical protein
MRDTPGRDALARALLVLVGPLSVLWVVAACSGGSGDAQSTQPPDGGSHLQVRDLKTPPTTGHFTADPIPVVARIGLTTNGCVTVEIDGIERLPVWPTGTSVDQDPDNFARYVVTLPDGATLATGDSFEATAVIDDNPEPFDPYSYVGTFLGYCAVEALPVAFFDAAAITPVVM